MTGPPVGIAQTLSARSGKPVHADAVGIRCAHAGDRGAKTELACANRVSAAARGNQDAVAIVGGQVIGGAQRRRYHRQQPRPTSR